MKLIKKLIRFSAALMVSISLVSVTPIFANPSLNLTINHLPTNSDTKPIIIKGSTLVPIRIISETLGAQVEWNSRSKKVKITHHDTRIEMTIGNPMVKVNELSQKILAAPVIRNGSTMLPIRFVGEALGAKVDWNEETKTVSVLENSLAEPVIPDFKEDIFGRAVRTTDLPKNASLFPYIAEGVPNWVYEKINLSDPALTIKAGINQLPRDLFQTPYTYDQMVPLLTNHFDRVLNIDYQTI